MGTVTTQVLSGPCILPGPAADGFRFPEPHPTPHGGAAFTSQPPTVPRGRLPSPTTLPPVSGHRVRAWSEGLQRPQAPALLASSPDPAGLPSSAFSAPHLLRRHRPLPRAAPAALPRATAALRHLRRPGASGAQRRPRVTSARGLRPLALPLRLQAALGLGPCEWFRPCLPVGPAPLPPAAATPPAAP